jgi:hypothetical protein
MNTPLKGAIVTGSTRRERRDDAVARWVLNLAKQCNDAGFVLVDIAD